MQTPVEEIKSRLDIVDVINEYVPLKPAGLSFKAKCPFHNEKTPSFMVSRERGTWHCFGCGRGGDVFTFVQDMESMDFPEVLRLLAKRAGVQLKDFDPKLNTQRTKVLDILRWVSRYYQEVLRKSNEAASARDYLVKRGLDETTIESFGIGFAPGGWEATFTALKKKGFTDDDIFQAGLTIKKDRGSGWYDRFRSRIMFPLADAQGTTIGFSGRILESAIDPNGPTPAKYVNSPQTIVYNKSMMLYGLDKAKLTIKKADRAVLVEGQMDAVASHQAGVTNVVAVSGTALTRDQVQLLKRFTTNLVFSFDQDAAGAQAALRGVEQALQASMNVMILRLPFGKDPDELIRKDPAAWSTAIEHAEPIVEYYFKLAVDGKNLNQVQDKKAVARDLLPLIAKIKDAIEQTHYLQRLADLVQVEVSALRQSLPSHVGTAAPVTAKSSAKPARPVVTAAPNRYRSVSERLLAFLLSHPSTAVQVIPRLDAEALEGEDLRTLYKTVALWYTQHHFSSRQDFASLIPSIDAEQQETINLLSMLADKEFPETVDASMEEDLLTMISSLKRYSLSRELQRIEADMRRLEQQGGASSQDMAPLIERFRSVTDQLRDMAV